MQHHLRATFLAGTFAVIPIAVTVAVVAYAEGAARAPLKGTFLDVPGVGLTLAVVLIYLTGLLVTSLVGRFFLGWFDRLLLRLPVLRELYKAWKQVSLSPGGGEGIYARVVLVPDGRGEQHVLGFSSGEPVTPGGDVVAVFVPNAPNPVTGRVAFIRRRDVIALDMTSEEAFKLLLSSGNYVPAAVATALARESTSSTHVSSRGALATKDLRPNVGQPD